MEPDIEHAHGIARRTVTLTCECGHQETGTDYEAGERMYQHREAVRQGIAAPEAAPPDRGALWSVLAALVIGAVLLAVGAVLTFTPITATNQWEFVAVLAALFGLSALLHWYAR